MLSSSSLAVVRRVLASSGAAAPWRQSAGLAARALVLRHAMPSVRVISISASMRTPAAKATTSKATKATKSSTKKPAAKKTAKPAAKKPAKKVVKKKAVAKKKVAVKKAKKTTAKRKTLTPEQKEKAEIRKLKQMALLKGPTFLPETAWNVYMVDNIRGRGGKLVDNIKVIASSFKNLPEAEIERLTSIGLSNKTANRESKKKWIESFPPEAIHAANLARRRLARKTDKSKVFLIHDERIPQRTGSGFNLYIKEYLLGSGSESPNDAMRSASERWKSLNPDEKAPYQKQAAAWGKESGGQLKSLREKGAKYWKEKLASPPAEN
ncbi:hypothetical protein V8C37DRAFT_150925 [Trichoderma ceciliae]